MFFLLGKVSDRHGPERVRLAHSRRTLPDGTGFARGPGSANENGANFMDAPAQSRSAWMGFPVPDFPPLTRDLQADVCVVGAGIAGLSTAYLLGKKGYRVVVIDDGPIGSGMTGRTTAHLF